MQKCFNGTKQRKKPKTQEGYSTLHIFPLNFAVNRYEFSNGEKHIQKQNVL